MKKGSTPIVSNREIKDYKLHQPVLFDYMKFMYKEHFPKAEKVITKKIDQFLKQREANLKAKYSFLINPNK